MLFDRLQRPSPDIKTPPREPPTMPETNAPFPRKLFYRIAEVAEIAGVETHVLRYWETRFSKLKPERLANDERRYRVKDVELILEIRRLLYDEKFTVRGAEAQLNRKDRVASPEVVPTLRREMATLANELRTLAAELE